MVLVTRRRSSDFEPNWRTGAALAIQEFHGNLQKGHLSRFEQLQSERGQVAARTPPDKEDDQ
jgi:hypothetical protein